jgi:hypothetical protein
MHHFKPNINTHMQNSMDRAALSCICNEFAQGVAEQWLGKQTSTERLFSMRSTPHSVLCNAEVNTSLQQLVDMQQ